jgi:hypothetical protein
MYYYGALNCSVTPHTSTSFTSNQYYNVPHDCPSSGCPIGAPDGCVQMQLMKLKYSAGKPGIPHVVVMDGSAPNSLRHYHKRDKDDPTMYEEGPKKRWGDWNIILDQNIKLKGTMPARYARLMLLLTSAKDADYGSPRFYLPVGQEIEQPDTSQEMAYSGNLSDYYVTVELNNVIYHVILVGN